MSKSRFAKTTVRELIDLLQTCPQDLPVFASVDDEGNDYKGINLALCGLAGYTESSHQLDIGIPYLDNELRKQGYEEDDVKDHQCIIIG